MQQGQQSGQSQTGTRDETYDLISIAYHALQGVETCRKYEQDASGDEELQGFFKDAQNMQRQLSDKAKQLLKSRLGQGGSEGGSAFSFREGQGGEQGASAGQGLGSNQSSSGGNA